jgi:hypothetical protein
LTIELDHILIFCAPRAPEAAALISHGFLEGSGQSHRGQGTANRRFCFANAYLELLWVENAAEAQSDVVLPTQLWARWQQRSNGVCPFGLAFRPGSDPSSSPAFPTWSYKPSYLPPDLSIEIGLGVSTNEPLLFHLPFAGNRRPPPSEPTNHPAQVNELSAIRLSFPTAAEPSAPLASLVSAGLVSICKAPEHLLEIEFVGNGTDPLDLRPDLPVVFTRKR